MPFGKHPVWMAFLELEDIHESAQPCPQLERQNTPGNWEQLVLR